MEQVAVLTGHVGIIYALQVIEAPSGGTRLFSACYDKTLRVSTCVHLLQCQGGDSCLNKVSLVVHIICIRLVVRYICVYYVYVCMYFYQNFTDVNM